MKSHDSIMYMVIRPVNPYILDIFHLCALPQNFNTRTRWRKKWLSDAVYQSPGDLNGTKVLIITHDTRNNTYYPVRWGTLERIDLVGGIYKIEFCVGKFVKIDSLGDYTIQEKIKDFSNYFKKTNKEFLSGNIDDRKNVFLKDDYSIVSRYLNVNDDSYNEVETWGKVTESLSAIPEFEGKEFIKIVDCKTLDGEPITADENKWVLQSNKIYEIKVLQHIYETETPPTIIRHDVEISGPVNHINLLKGKAAIVGKYDYISLKFKTQSLNKSENSYILLSVNNDIIDIYNSYEIEIPTIIKPVPKTFSLISLALATVFAITLVINSVTSFIPSEYLEVARVLLIIFTIPTSDAINYLTSK